MPNRNRRLTIIALLMLLGGMCIILTALLIPVGQAALALKADIDAIEALAEQDLELIDMDAALELLHTTQTDLDALRSSARPFLWAAPYLGWLPVYGPDIRSAPALLDMGNDLIGAGLDVVDRLAPLLEEETIQGSEAGSGFLSVAIDLLADAHPQLLTARVSVQRARTARATIDAEELSPRFQGWVAKLDRYLPLLEQGVGAAIILPELMGASSPQTYLVLVQNEDELRATGGFISGVAQLTVADGQIAGLQFEDSYNIDDLTQPYPDPPLPLREYMMTDLWLFRDSNWSPDFPTSAQTAISLYTTGRDVTAAGVVALDQQAIQLLVEALGPFNVTGYDTPITGDNVIQLARQAWAPGDEPADDWWRHRKDFMADLLQAAVGRIEGSLDRSDLINLAQAALQAVEQRHLMFYRTDPETGELLAELGWDGALRDSPGDFLMVVDTNMGFNKVNAVVEERIEYLVNLTDLTQPRAILGVHHYHPVPSQGTPCDQAPRYDPTYEQMMERCYWDYLRVHVPAGSVFLEGTPHPISGSELLSGQDVPAQVVIGPPEQGREVFSTFMLLKPGESLDTFFEYTLPSSVTDFQNDRYVYNLVIQKQPGTQGVPVEVIILLPPGSRVLNSVPAAAQSSEVGLTYELALTTDQAIEVTFELAP